MINTFRTILVLIIFLYPSVRIGAQGTRVMYDRKIFFSGFEWLVKSSWSRTGPGPNFFSQSEKNVSVDKKGRLHLEVTRDGGRWLCAEVVSKEHFGYGRYEVLLGTNPAQLDDNLVLGIFTWNPLLIPHHNEIDIEFSNWGGRRIENGQYVIHTGIDQMEKKKFTMPEGPRSSLHVIIWKPGKLVFESYRGQRAWPWRRIASWSYKGVMVPEPDSEELRLNLWITGPDPLPERTEGKRKVRIDRISYEKLSHD